MAYIGEKGVNISGGQRARLALARLQHLQFPLWLAPNSYDFFLPFKFLLGFLSKYFLEICAVNRAIYHGSDIFMLDDVLSAVDAQVAQWILYNAILGPLMKQCTRVLCTHNVQVIPLKFIWLSHDIYMSLNVIKQIFQPQDQPIRGLFSMKEISHFFLEHIVYIHIVLLYNNDAYYQSTLTHGKFICLVATD